MHWTASYYDIWNDSQNLSKKEDKSNYTLHVKYKQHNEKKMSLSSKSDIFQEGPDLSITGSIRAIKEILYKPPQ